MRCNILRHLAVSWSGVSEAAAILAGVFAIQMAADAIHRDFAGHSDEGAHFVTGLMVHDYFASAPGSSPLAFASEYYVRYPKVALGQWPPVFYGLQCIWYLLAGVSKTSATVLVGLISATTIWCLYRRLRYENGMAVAVVATVVLLGQPLVQSLSVLVMADMAACLCTLIAVFAFSDFLSSGNSRHIAFFAFWSSLAILTRPSALALAAFVPICLLVTGRLAVVRDRRVWGAGIAIGVLTAPFYLWSWCHGMGLHTHGSISRLVSESVRISRNYHATDAWMSVASGWLVAVAA
ncbi:MAG: glycosyltransferase family 39 protein [Planctomycetaceae bacterium]